MRKSNSLPVLLFVVILCVGLAFAYSTLEFHHYGTSLLIAVGFAIAAFIVSHSKRFIPASRQIIPACGICSTDIRPA